MRTNQIESNQIEWRSDRTANAMVHRRGSRRRPSGGQLTQFSWSQWTTEGSELETNEGKCGELVVVLVVAVEMSEVTNGTHHRWQ